MTEGRILGHEGVGTIIEVGPAVDHARRRRPRDHLLHQLLRRLLLLPPAAPAHCLADEGASGIGWIFGHLIDGTQAEYVRVPFADNSLLQAARGRERRGRGDAVRHPADRVRDRGAHTAGSSPATWSPSSAPARSGLAAIMTAGLYGAARVIAIDLDDNRLEQAQDVRRHRRASTAATRTGRTQVMAMTDGFGVDVAIEAVGVPATFDDVHRARAPRRDGGQRRRARQARGARAAGPVDQGHRDHHGAGQHHDTPMLLKLVAQRQAHAGEVRDPPVRASTRSSTPTTRSAVPPRRRPSRWPSRPDVPSSDQ